MDGLKEEISILNKNNHKSNKIYDELKFKMQEEVKIKYKKNQLFNF